MDPASENSLSNLDEYRLTKIDIYRDNEIRGIRTYRTHTDENGVTTEIPLVLHGTDAGLTVQTLEFDPDECINSVFVSANKRVDKVGFYFKDNTSTPYSRGGTGGNYNDRSLGSGCLIGFKGRYYSGGINALGFIYTSFIGLSSDGYA